MKRLTPRRRTKRWITAKRMSSRRQAWTRVPVRLAILTVGCALVLSAVAVMSPHGAYAAESLWQQAENPVSLFRDRTASRVGDLVTILIQEQSSATQSADTDGEQSTEFRIAPDGGLLTGLLPVIGASARDGESARGSTNRAGTLEARITATVVEVLPNGTLRIEGQQKIRVNGEEQSITLSGVIRPEDITADNTVLSTFIADGEIGFEGDGVVSDKQSPGLLSRLFNWIF